MTTETAPTRRGFSWGQAGAAGAGVLSLIFVGWEVRQNTDAVRGATYQAVADANMNWLTFMAENDFDVLVRRWARSLNRVFWRTVENAHYQYLQATSGGRLTPAFVAYAESVVEDTLMEAQPTK